MTTVAVPIEKEADDFCIYESLHGTAVSWRLPSHDGFVRQSQHVSDSVIIKRVSILGKLSEITEEQCKGLVESIQSDRGEVYQNYESEFQGAFHWTAKQSLISKLKSEGKYCKWIAEQMPMFSSLPTQYQQLPDDFLILITP